MRECLYKVKEFVIYESGNSAPRKMLCCSENTGYNVEKTEIYQSSDVQWYNITLRSLIHALSCWDEQSDGSYVKMSSLKANLKKEITRKRWKKSVFCHLANAKKVGVSIDHQDTQAYDQAC